MSKRQEKTSPIKITLNPKGLTRAENIAPEYIKPKHDLNPDNIIITQKGHYLVITKKEKA